MLEKIPMEAETIDFDFLLYRDHHYELITRKENDLEFLPSISRRWEKHLVHKGIAHNIVGDICTIYDKDLYKSDKRYFPVYEKIDGIYKYTGKYHAKKIPTKESIVAAKAIFEEFMEYIKENECIEELRKMMGKRKIIFIPKPTQIPIEKYDLMSKYRIFRYGVSIYGYILVDCKKIAEAKKSNKKVTLTLWVPLEYIGVIIGKDKKNIEKLQNLIGVEKINVLPIKKKKLK